MEIKVLLENTKPKGSTRLTTNGLSLLVARDGKKILFDTGMKGLAMKSAKALGVDLSQVDLVQNATQIAAGKRTVNETPQRNSQ